LCITKPSWQAPFKLCRRSVRSDDLGFGLIGNDNAAEAAARESNFAKWKNYL